jgi:predicted amidohydrolase YtcJ
MTRSILTLLLAAVAVTACSQSAYQSGHGDYAFINAKAYTLNSDKPWAETVVVKGDSIVYVGDAGGAAPFIGESTVQRDVGGQLLLPGFIDTHAHPVSGGGYATALSLDTYGVADDWVAAIAAYADENPDLPVVFGYGFLATAFGPVGPTRQLIDEVVPDRIVLIMDEGFHAAWANSAALDALNITQDTADPVPGYSYYKRDKNDDATGYLLEGTANTAMATLDVITPDIVVEGTGIIVDIMNSYGVTAVFDAGANGDAEFVKQVLDELESSGGLTIRIVGSSRPRVSEQAATAVDTAEEWGRQVRGQRYHYNTLKIPDDGTVEGRTAAMFEDYQGEPGNSGATVFTEEQMTQMITDAASRSMDVHIHALGERAIHETLNAIEVARAEHPNSETRYTICHVEVITDQDVPRFAELDVIAQSTPLWASYDEYGEQFVSEDQFNRFWRFKSLEDAGARLTFGSDFPSSGAGTLGLSPVVQIEIGHTRQFAGEPDALIQPPESERLSVESLVRGFTIDAAYQLHMEDEIGSIEVGKKADLIVLDQNIFEVDTYSIHKTDVVLTMMDGDIVYEAENTAGLSQSAELPSLPHAVTNNAVVSVRTDDNEYLVSFAGLGAGKSHDDTLDETWVFNRNAGEWAQAAPVPGGVGRLASVAASVGGTAYVFGGYSVAPDGTEVSTPWVHAFDPATGQFTELATMPLPVDDAVAVTFEDRFIYLISGWHDLGNVNLVQRYDTVGDSWSQATPTPGPGVFGHAGGIIGNRIVYCDGVAIEPHVDRRRDFVAVSDCYMGIIDSNDSRRIDWRTLPPHPGKARYRMAATGTEAMNGVLFVGGSENPYNYDGIGYNGEPSEPTKGSLLFDVALGRWRAIPLEGTATMDHRGLVQFGDALVSIGGMQSGQQVINNIYSYTE